MPITGPASYLSTMDDFYNHWVEVDTALGGAGTFRLAGGTTQHDFDNLRTDLQNLQDAVTDANFERSLEREQLNARIAALHDRLVEFNERVRADFPDSPYSRVLPTVFTVGEAEGIVRAALRDMSNLWTKINAISPAPAGVTLPLLLLDGYALATFTTDFGTLRQGYRELATDEQTLKLARETRNDLQDVVYDLMKMYRQKVPTAFPPGHALLDSLPALTPAPGRTPAAVIAHGVWDAATSQAKVTWDASAEAELKEYQVRGVAGDSYNADDESVLVTALPNAAREFFTTFALTQAGLTTGFKVYVILTTGNEKGSEAVYVTRP